MATDALGEKIWALDNDDHVYVYDGQGNLLGSWLATGLRVPTGIATDGTDIWIADRLRREVYRYEGAANRLSGSQAPNSSFDLAANNSSAYGITTDGTFLWVVNGSLLSKAVFKYNVAGESLGNWTIDSSQVRPRGITIDPSGVSASIWIVDSSRDQVFEYSNALNRTSGSHSADAVFDLDDENRSPEGIFISSSDIPASPSFTISESGGSTQVSESGSQDTFTVVLTAQPSSNVVIDVVSGDVDEATVLPTSLTFTASSWNVPQTVAVTGVDDAISEGGHVTLVTLSVDDSKSDDAFDNVPNQTVSVITRDDDNPPGFAIVESGGSTQVSEPSSQDTFTVVLTAQPSSNVVIDVVSGDVGEATVLPATLTFTASSWNVPQSVTVTGVDDAITDGDQTTLVTLSINDATSDDVFDSVVDQTVNVISRDDELPQPGTQTFFVVDSSDDATFQYDASFGLVNTRDLSGGNSIARGVATDALGEKVWVLDNDKHVYVYDERNNLLGSWLATGLLTPEGIATDGTDIWIVDRFRRDVFKYEGAAIRLSGSQAPDSSFDLAANNSSAYGMTTDGTFLWIVNDSFFGDSVFKYNVAGESLGNWTIDSSQVRPRGITIDPSGVSASIWIVDSSRDQVFEYSNALNRTSGSHSADAVFDLDDENRSPEGIADPQRSQAKTPVGTPNALDAALAARMFAADSSFGFGVIRPIYSNIDEQHSTSSDHVIRDHTKDWRSPPASARRARNEALTFLGQARFARHQPESVWERLVDHTLTGLLHDESLS